MAYTTATLVRKDPPLDDGRVWITAEFTGNAGDPPIRQRYLVGPSDTITTIRHWAISVASNLGSTKNIADNLTVGQSVNLTPIPPPADPVPTAKEVWLDKFRRYQRMSGTTIAGQFAVDMDTLKADLEATYVTGYF